MEEKSFPLDFNEKNILCIFGLDKNAGKTTVLNYIIKQCELRRKKALLISIGRDGEEEDILEKTEKPKINIRRNNYFITGEKFIKNYSNIRIIENLNIKTPAGNLLLTQAIEDMQIQLVNPSNIDEIAKISHKYLNEGLCDIVLIDGALDRISHLSGKLSNKCILVVGTSSEGDLEKLLEKAEFYVNKLELPVCDIKIKREILEKRQENKSIIFHKNAEREYFKESLLIDSTIKDKIKDGDYIYCNGLIGEKVLKNIIETNLNINLIIEDGSKLIVDREIYMRSKKRIKIYSLYNIEIIAIAQNSFGIRKSFDPIEMQNRLRDLFPKKFIFDTFFINPIKNGNIPRKR